LIAIVSCRPQVRDDTECALCEFIIKTVEGIIGDNATEQEIVNAVTHVCDILPRTIRPQCQQFIQQNGQALIEILIEQEPPHTACTQLGFCTSKKIRIDPKPEDNSLCPICQMFVTLTESYLAQNSTIQEFERYLHQFPCSFFFDGDLEKQCEAFVDQYVPQLIDWVEKNETPNVFCTQAGLC